MYENFKKPFILVKFGFSNFLVTLHGSRDVIYGDSTFSTKILKKDKLSKETFISIFDKVLDVALQNEISSLNVYISGNSHNKEAVFEELKKMNISVISSNI